MSAPGLASVTGWRPEALGAAGDDLARLAERVTEAVHNVGHGLATALDDAGGEWASSAARRADEESRRGATLADVLGEGARLLTDAGDALTAARRRLLAVVDAARAAGFTVADDGTVGSPPMPDPPPDVPPAERLAWGVGPEAQAAAALVERRRAALQAEVDEALHLVAATDESVAAALARLDPPDTLATAARALLTRVGQDPGDPVAALGALGGPVVLAQTARTARGLVNRSRALGRYAALARAGAPAAALEDARRVFATGSSVRTVGRVAGRLNLPLTVVGAAGDVTGGGGYDGARGWATRGFAVAGGAGAVAVMVSATPAVVVVGGAAVIAYGAWSAGNYVVDHWDQVEDAWDASTDWVQEQQDAAYEEVGDAVGWARERLGAMAGAGAWAWPG